jgi:hypothetical protein
MNMGRFFKGSSYQIFSSFGGLRAAFFILPWAAIDLA